MRCFCFFLRELFYALLRAARSERGTRFNFETSIPSRIIASSLARNSTARAPFSTRGILETPASRRLYHRTNPARSHTKIFSRSPRRERNTNRWPLCGFSPMTARTRSARRSNPQRMSVASLAIQIRAPCARSIACKLGSPITPLPPLPPTTLAHVRHRILASPSGFAHSAAGLRSTSPPISWPGLRHLHFNESRRRVFPQPFFPPVEMRRAQLLLSAELRHTLP